MRRLIALSAFLGLFAAISFVTTNRIESYNRLHGGISLFSSYKEFSGLFAKQDSDTSACITKCMNNSDDTCKRDKECCSMACDAKGTNNDNGYWSGVQRCGDGKITRPREQCEKNKDCTAGKTCKNCKCIEENKEVQCSDPEARKGNLWIEGEWNCNRKNGKGGSINMKLNGKDVNKVFGKDSHSYGYRYNDSPRGKKNGIECKDGKLKTRWSFSGKDKSKVYMRIEPKSYKKEGCYETLKRWNFYGKYNGKEFKINTPSKCYLKSTKSGRSGKIICYDVNLEYEENKDDDDSDEEEEEDKKKDKKKKDKKDKKEDREDEDKEDKEDEDDEEDEDKKKKDKKDKKKDREDEEDEEDEDEDEDKKKKDKKKDKKDKKDKKKDKDEDEEDNSKASAPEKKKDKAKKDKKDKNPLGCFNKSGNWTNKRSNCDKNQRKHYQKVAEQKPLSIEDQIPEAVLKTIKKEVPKKHSEAEEKIIKDKLKKKYVSSNKFKKKRKKLQKLIKKTQRKIKTLRKSKNMVQQVDTFLLTSLDWLETQHNYVQNRQIESNELSLISEYIKRLVISIEDLLNDMPKTNKPTSNVKIDEIFSKVAILIDKFPRVVSALWQEEIDVDENIVDDYFEMRNDFLKLWDECKADISVCTDLEDILEKYEDIKEALEKQINGSGNNNARDIVRKTLET